VPRSGAPFDRGRRLHRVDRLRSAAAHATASQRAGRGSRPRRG
jgi:hypothetical protein